MKHSHKSPAVRNDLQIEYPRSNNGLALVFPLLDIHVSEAMKPESAAFPGEPEETEIYVRLIRSVLQDHRTVNVLHQGETEQSLCHYDILSAQVSAV